MPKDNSISRDILNGIGEWCLEHLGALICIGLVLFFICILGGFINWRVQDIKNQPIQDGVVINTIMEENVTKCVIQTTKGQKLVSPDVGQPCVYIVGDKVKIKQSYTGSRYGDIQ